MEPIYRRITTEDRDALADWLAADTWPFHTGDRPSREQALKRFDDGDFTGAEVQSYWMLLGDEPIGLLMLNDIEDRAPMLDLRLRTAYRGQGWGTVAVRWMTRTIFESFPEAIRVEGQTREDNLAMRRTFRKVGYLKEAHYRAAWPTADGGYVASIGYGILRSDWENRVVTPLVWDDER